MLRQIRHGLKGREFYNRSLKLWLKDENIENHLTHNERKSVTDEQINRAIKNKIQKHILTVSKVPKTIKTFDVKLIQSMILIIIIINNS